MPSPLTVLNAISNILAQLIDQRKNTVPSIDDIVLEDFPVPNTNYRQSFLGDNKQLSTHPLPQSLLISYDLEDRHSIAEFDYTFEKPARLIGLTKAVLYMSCEDRDDFIAFVIQASIKR
ncbi:uncharacterized protein N7458_007551 [Penicillium daleae]|uniref:Xaa-Pro dipeptidyl-peptidase C-terminal domain-containing protein n=1 Tax=Penicillium daleae TaxID=63821 RepID=A0AAD6G0E5_9EURO|nr:uncharacterized protein N7458_007551 [Penicillium daleae]KAJ5443679.1 hypothetical protein N7458_007551 [Penicillium daleae]